MPKFLMTQVRDEEHTEVTNHYKKEKGIPVATRIKQLITKDSGITFKDGRGGSRK